jgi:DNA (cytosine-5)-methyltransferase 1
MRTLHLFAGAGGSHLAGFITGWQSVGSVEIDPYRRGVLARHFPDEPIHDDVTTLDATPLAGHVDLVVGGSPCQDISVAGKGAGLAGARSGLLRDQLRLVRECGAPFMFWENVAAALTSPSAKHGTPGEDWRTFMGWLTEDGMDAEWITLSASAVGAPHQRKRVWLLAWRRDADLSMLDPWARLWPAGTPEEELAWARGVVDARCRELAPQADALGLDWPALRGEWPAGPKEPQHPWEPPRIIDKTSVDWKNRNHRVAALGDGWVPPCAAVAWWILCRRARA